MRHGSLFSGWGGFDLVSEWMGWNNIFHCELNEFNQRMLQYYWPNAISYGDIKKTDFTIHRGSIDILTGGFPCQPYSTSGKRLGKEDDRHLWPEMLRAIQEIEPRWIVGENVHGIVNWNDGLVFNEVQVDLEIEGYEVQPYILPAAGVNAPHQRSRVWFVAHSNGSEQADERGENLKTERILRGDEKGNVSGTLSSYEYATDPHSGERKIRSHDDRVGRARKQNEEDPWSQFPTVDPFCTGHDGLSFELDGITFQNWKKESMSAAGNSIVPQLALQIFKVIERMERSSKL